MRFKQGFTAALFLAAMMLAAPAGAAEYKIDKAHTFVQFRVIHLGYSWLIGRFDDFEGSFDFDPKAGENAQSIEFTVRTESINTGHAERDKHLRSPDFLNVGEYPTATFRSTGYSGDAEGGVMAGELTLHGTTQPVEIEVTKIGEGKDPWGGYRAGFEGTMEIDRAQFGIDYDLGPEAETVYMELYVEGIRQ